MTLRPESGDGKPQLPDRPTLPLADPCPGCGEIDRVQAPGKPPHHGAEVCAGCGRHFRWLAAPVTAARALAYTMPYGSYRGRTLGWLSQHDKPYLRWLIAAFTDSPAKRRIAELAKVALAAVRAEGGAA